jgi:adenosylhomocysteine nucleosidase
MKILVIIPTRKEFDFFLKACTDEKIRSEDSKIGRLPVVKLPDLDITLAVGGLGKVQFAVHAQHLLDSSPGWDLVVCAGAAGSIKDGLSIGDVVVSTETVEHDIDNKVGPPIIPRFNSEESKIAEFKSITPVSDLFQVHFGPIASGDEDVMDSERRSILHDLTGGIAVAWEGAGGARACRFNDTPFIEIRGITDNACGNAVSDYWANLERVMGNVANLIISWARELKSKGNG